MTVTANPYLQGNFAPVHEEVTATELAVTGRVPECPLWPLPAERPESGVGARAGGLPLVHRRRDGPRDPPARRAGGVVPEPLGPLRRRGRGPWARSPVPAPVHAGMDFAANTNVIGHAGRTFAIVEAGARPYELTDELDTIGPCDFGGTLAGGYTAHPKRDPLTGELYAVSYFFGWGDEVEVTVLDAQARVRSARRVTMGGPVSVHDTAITQRYVVLLDLPVTFSMEAVAAGALFPYRWQEGYRARVGLLPRDGDATDVVWHDVDPCYVFHPMNAFDVARRRRGRARRRAAPLHVPDPAARPGRGVAHARAVASRRARRRSQGGAARRPRPGVPARRRAAGRPAAPLRLRGGRRRVRRHRRHRVGA